MQKKSAELIGVALARGWGEGGEGVRSGHPRRARRAKEADRLFWKVLSAPLARK